MKKSSKVLMLIACVAMVLCFSIGVSAVEYDKTYTIGNGTTDAIDVTLTIEGDGIAFDAIPVSLDASTSAHKVVDAMLESEVAAAGYTFYTASTSDNVTTYTPITASSTYFSDIKIGSTYYDGDNAGYEGWCFRINGGIPLQTNGWGATIATAVINDGDVIAIHIDDPISESASTRFTRASVTSATASAVSVNVKESHQYYGADWAWEVTDFTAIGGMTAELYSGTALTSSNLVASRTVSALGRANFTNLDLATGTYTVKVCGNMSGSPAVSSCIVTFTIE